MLDLRVVYPGQINNGDSGWPYGKFQNVTVSGDGTGTPLEASWPNDIQGFFQNLLDVAGLQPSGVPEKVGNSQLTDAIQSLIAAPVDSLTETLATVSQQLSAQQMFSACSFVAGGAYNNNAQLPLTTVKHSNGGASPGFLNQGTSLKVPDPAVGWYLALATLTLSLTSADDPQDIAVTLRAGTAALMTGRQRLPGGGAANISLAGVVSVTNPGTQAINVISLQDLLHVTSGTLIVRRLL